MIKQSAAMMSSGLGLFPVLIAAHTASTCLLLNFGSAAIAALNSLKICAAIIGMARWMFVKFATPETPSSLHPPND